MDGHTLFECESASIWLPDGAREIQPFPKFGADFGDGTVLVDLVSDEFLWNSFKQCYSEPVYGGTTSNLQVLRQGEVHLQYDGIELVFEQWPHDSDKYFYFWKVLFEQEKSRVAIEINGPGRFAEHEERWLKVIKSFRFK